VRVLRGFPLSLEDNSGDFLKILIYLSLDHSTLYSLATNSVCRAMAQAVSRRLPTAAARVQAQVRSCGIRGGQSGTGTGLVRVLRFPLPILIPPTAPHSSSSIIRGWYNRPIVADVKSGLSLTPRN
jgi:hypothetical protein